MFGKAKCKILKEIRQKIADANDIPYVTRECSYQGDCSGTCPRCESELRYLERELEARQRRGKTLAVTALCAGLVLGGTGCTPSDNAPTLAGDLPRMEDIADTEPGNDAPSLGADGGETQTVPPLEGEVQPIDDLAPEAVAAALPEDDAPSAGADGGIIRPAAAPEDEVLPIDAPELEGKLVLPPDGVLAGDVALPPEVELMGEEVLWDESEEEDDQKPTGDALPPEDTEAELFPTAGVIEYPVDDSELP